MPNPVIHFEIESTDQAATRAFFGEVFGWKTDYMPEMDYALVDTRSEGAGINGGIGPAHGEYGSCVTFYIAVDDAQAYLDKAVAAGGKVIMPVTKIPNAVTLAMFTDPTGAAVGLVLDEPQPRESADENETGTSESAPGSGKAPCPVVSFEIKSTDIAATAAFFSEVFGWEAHIDPEYGGFMDTRSEIGVMGGVGPALEGRGSAPTFYIGVDDVQAYLDKAAAAGGEVVAPPMEISEGVSLALFSDPAGAVVGLILNE